MVRLLRVKKVHFVIIRMIMYYVMLLVNWCQCSSMINSDEWFLRLTFVPCGWLYKVGRWWVVVMLVPAHWPRPPHIHSTFNIHIPSKPGLAGHFVYVVVTNKISETLMAGCLFCHQPMFHTYCWAVCFTITANSCEKRCNHLVCWLSNTNTYTWIYCCTVLILTIQPIRTITQLFCRPVGIYMPVKGLDLEVSQIGML